jgi:hypothetical protein
MALAVLFLLVGQGAHAGTSWARELLPLAHRLDTVEDLAARGLLAPPVAADEVDATIRKAREIGGPSIDRAMLRQVAAAAAEPGTFERLRDAMTFLNLVAFLAAAMFVVALLRLVVLHLMPLLADLPLWAWELGGHTMSTALTLGGVAAGPVHGEWVGLVGCLLWAGAVGFSFARRRTELGRLATPTSVSLTLCALWSCATVLHGSSMLAYLAVAALLSALGFSVLVVPGAAVLGYSSKEPIPRALVGSLLILIAGLAGTLGGSPGVLAPFVGAAVRLGAFVYLVTLLIVSTRHYGHATTTRYLAFQVLTLASCLAGGWLGAVQGIDVLRRFAGTTLVIYLLEKYWEIPWRRQQVAWALLLFSLLLYVATLVVRAYPAYFLF